MKEILFFLVGLALGAIGGLMLAPKSGQELRGDIQQRANVDMQKLQQSYEQGMAEMNKKLEQVQAQLKKSQESGEDIAQDIQSGDAPAAA